MGRVERSNYSVYIGEDPSRTQRNEEKQKEEKKGNNIYAGDLKMAEDSFTAKKKQLHKQAMKVALDQFETDKKIDADLDVRRRHIADMQEEAAWANDQMNQCREELAKIKEEYGIADDSQEQMDLELIRKAGSSNGVSSLSDEEVERLANMGELTEYQQAALSYDEVISFYQDYVDEAYEVIAQETRSIEAIKQGLNGRKYDMTDAASDKDAQMISAAKELAGTLFAEAKDKIDEEFAELVEKAKEEAEKRKEEEKLLEEQKAENAETENKAEEIRESAQQDIVDMSDRVNKVQEEVNRLLKEADLLGEDLKGIQVDRQL